MRAIAALTAAVALAVCLTLGCATTTAPEPAPAPETAQAAPPSVESVLPAPTFADGWTALETAAYDADALFEYINGEADLYYPYGFRKAASALYVTEDETSATSIDAGVFHMGSPLDAFGIYSNYRGGRGDQIDIGADARISDQQLVFYQDAYFVRITIVGRHDDPRSALTACGTAIAERLPESAPPGELALIDSEGVDPDTAVYIAQSLLGYAFFPRGLLANADEDCGARARVFIVLAADDAEAEGCLAAYLAYLDERDATHEAADDGTVLAQDPLHGSTLIRCRGPYVYGATGLDAPDAAAQLLDALAAAL